MATLVWFRNDLRVDDNTALHAALTRGGRVAAVFYATPDQWREHALAPVKGEFLWRTLEELRVALARLNVPLFVRIVDRFDAVAADLDKFARKHQCEAVFANREYPVDEQRRDEAVAAALARANMEWNCFDDATLVPPGSVRTRTGQPFKVFTPFKRALLELVETAPLHCLKPRKAEPFGAEAPPLPKYPYESSNVPAKLWPAGEKAAAARLRKFIDGRIDDYAEQRDIPALDGTSALSPYLALGVISLRRCAEAALAANGGLWQGGSGGAATWLNELLWREFYIHVLAQFPRVSMNKPMRKEAESLVWRRDKTEFQRWCEGRTGFPLVDAGMRQLVQTGWMHNRLRMVTAMFLSKYLLLDWRWGEQFFMRHLIDGDLAANNGGWQWSASTGTDAAPYFRLLSPLRQAERFDPDGTYCKKFVPELKHVPVDALLKPGDPRLIAAGYPPPMVDLKAARARVLQAFSAANSQYREHQHE
jgi:deoxyribodipyrimidine photo-lyase